MQVFTVRHLTRYRYASPVRFGEHRMMLRPRADGGQILLSERLRISPTPDAVEVVRDPLGNWIASVRFSKRAPELMIESEIKVATASTPQSGHFCGPLPATTVEGDRRVTDWARQTMINAGWDGGDVPDAAALALLCRSIRERLAYRRRLERGVQDPLHTIELGSGACRDFAMLMVVAARGFGLQARFASGYLHCSSPDEARIGGHTHAWACIETNENGWTDFDPTSGRTGPKDLIRVALADDPEDAAPISGVWFGRHDDFLGMDVQVDVWPASRLSSSWSPEDEPLARLSVA